MKLKQVCVYEPEQPQPQRHTSVPAASSSTLSSVESDQNARNQDQNQIEEPDLSRGHHQSRYSNQASPAWRPPSSQGESFTALNSVATSPILERSRPVPKTVGFNFMPQENLQGQGMDLSPIDSWTESPVNVERDTAGWFGLLFGDAVLGNSSLPDINFEEEGTNIFGNSVPPTRAQTPHGDAAQTSNGDTVPPGNGPIATASPAETSNKFLLERVPRLRRDQLFEIQSWHSSEPIKLLSEEQFLFQHFVRHLSQWIDFFDPKTPFSTFVPHLALHNVGLLNAILALSVRHLSLKATTNGTSNSHIYGDPVQYYYKTLHYIQKAMQYDTYTTSLELLSTALIVSTYEMLDGSNKDWERHLKGVFWIQRSQVIHGDSKGLRSAVWWAWLCQDAWAAFREKRKPFSFWKPARTFEALDPHELAARSVYLFAQVVGYCSAEAVEADGDNLAVRAKKAAVLGEKLEEWRMYLTIDFDPMLLFEQAPPRGSQNAFEPVWIHPPAFGKFDVELIAWVNADSP